MIADTSTAQLCETLASKTTIPIVMDAVAIDRYGSSEELRLRRMFTPNPGWGQVLVRVRAVGLNPADWKIRRGMLRMIWRPKFPLVLGFDIAGEVAAVGPGVYGWELGNAVIANTFSQRSGCRC